jgi:hypothetical protein
MPKKNKVPEVTFTDEEKNKFLEIIKTLDLDAMVIPDEAKRKWYTFGAYDALKILAERILKL